MIQHHPQSQPTTSSFPHHFGPPSRMLGPKPRPSDGSPSSSPRRCGPQAHSGSPTPLEYGGAELSLVGRRPGLRGVRTHRRARRMEHLERLARLLRRAPLRGGRVHDLGAARSDHRQLGATCGRRHARARGLSTVRSLGHRERHRHRRLGRAVRDRRRKHTRGAGARASPRRLHDPRHVAHHRDAGHGQQDGPGRRRVRSIASDGEPVRRFPDRSTALPHPCVHDRIDGGGTDRARHGTSRDRRDRRDCADEGNGQRATARDALPRTGPHR